jgi:hypothetical protein
MQEIDISKINKGTDAEIMLDILKTEFESIFSPTNKQCKDFLIHSLMLLNLMLITYAETYTFMEKMKIKFAIKVFQNRLGSINKKNESDIFNKDIE